MIFKSDMSPEDARELSLRNLAHLGDAVFELYEREKEVSEKKLAKQIHKQVVSRVNARSQAELLHRVTESLTESESDLVRRARNLKVGNFKKVDQSVYRQATAFEALIGYLYVTDMERLKQILAITDAEDLEKLTDLADIE